MENGTTYMTDGFCGGGFIWAFLIFALLMGNGSFGLGNNGFANAIGYENLATSNEVQRGFDNQNTMANQREILNAVTSGTAQSVAATNQTFHDMLGVFSDKYSELQRDISNVQLAQAQALANQNECCCSTKMEIAQNRYDAAMNTAAINANSTAIGQKILDKLNENETKAMQNRINQLELAQALNGVVRYPNGITYTAGTSPFCNCGSAYPLI